MVPLKKDATFGTRRKDNTFGTVKVSITENITSMLHSLIGGGLEESLRLALDDVADEVVGIATANLAAIGAASAERDSTGQLRSAVAKKTKIGQSKTYVYALVGMNNRAPRTKEPYPTLKDLERSGRLTPEKRRKIWGWLRKHTPNKGRGTKVRWSRSGRFYAHLLEGPDKGKGYAFMHGKVKPVKKRPFLEPALDRIKPKFIKAVRENLQRRLKGQ